MKEVIVDTQGGVYMFGFTIGYEGSDQEQVSACVVKSAP